MKSTTKRWAAILAVAAACPGPALAQDVTLALPAISMIFSPAYVAEERGFWKQRGLNVKTILVAGPGATNAVLSGSAEVTSTGPGPMFRAVARGQKLQAIASTADKMLLELVLRGDVAQKIALAPGADLKTRARALKGLSIGVDSINGFAHGYLRYIAGRTGMDPEKDVIVSPMQPPSMVAALQAQRVDGFIFSQPWTLQAMKQTGAVRWISGPGGDTPEVNPFAYNVFVVRGGWCEQNEATCEKFVAGLKDALAYIQDQPAPALDIVRRRAAPQLDPQLVAEAWEVVRATLPRSPEISQAAMKNAENFSVTAGLLDEKERVANWNAVLTNKYVK
jgi:ABC-type nitrate/sulfonate/bicarbonate transport system substrate-binding protein